MTTTTAAPSQSTFSVPRGAGPLTTVFTTPYFCDEGHWASYDTPALSSSICMPSGFNSYFDYMYGFYSPGICPESYTPGCDFPTSAATSSNGTPFLGGPLDPGETGIVCCPIGYKCLSAPSDTGYLYSKCIATTVSSYTLDLPTVTAVTTTPLVFAIQVRWKSSDWNNLETNPTKSGETITPTPTAATSDSTSTTTATAIPTADADPSPTSEGDGLSTGAKIGLGVGIGVGAVLLGIIAYLLWRRKSQRASSSQEAGGSGGKGFSELQDTQVSKGPAGTAAGGGATELESPAGDTWNSSNWGGSTVYSPLTPRPATSTTAGATEMEVPNTRHELAGDVTDFAEMPASNQFVAELPGDTPVQTREKWN